MIDSTAVFGSVTLSRVPTRIHQLTSAIFGEFMGTLVLVLLGDGVVAERSADKNSKAENPGWMVITAGWAFAVMCGDLHGHRLRQQRRLSESRRHARLRHRSGNSRNSAALSHSRRIARRLCGAVLVWLHFLPHAATPDTTSKLACFCTDPRNPQRSEQPNQRNPRHPSSYVFVVGRNFLESRNRRGPRIRPRPLPGS